MAGAGLLAADALAVPSYSWPRHDRTTHPPRSQLAMTAEPGQLPLHSGCRGHLYQHRRSLAAHPLWAPQSWRCQLVTIDSA
jgi:hypothetical protein